MFRNHLLGLLGRSNKGRLNYKKWNETWLVIIKEDLQKYFLINPFSVIEDYQIREEIFIFYSFQGNTSIHNFF
jgi:hypothetical protein